MSITLSRTETKRDCHHLMGTKVHSVMHENNKNRGLHIFECCAKI